VQEDRLSILASLETRERELFAPGRSSSKGWWIFGLLVLTSVAAAYVYTHVDELLAPANNAEKVKIASPSATNRNQSPKVAQAAETGLLPAAASSAAAASASVAAAASAPARIEVVEPVVAKVAGNDPFATLAAAPAASAPAQGASAPTPAASAAPATAVAAASATSPAVPAAVSHAATVVAKATKPSSHKATHPHAEVVASQKYHTAQTSSQEPAKPKTATGGRDPDVDLLAALMAHVGNPDAKGARTNANLDDTSIAKLVKRCESMNGDEAMQCQKRICDGYWGKAQACPVRTAAKRE
jgi:hypothetical protein